MDSARAIAVDLAIKIQPNRDVKEILRDAEAIWLWLQQQPPSTVRVIK